MNAEEKQALTGLCKIEIKRWKAASESNPNMRYMAELMEVALAALTAQPVISDDTRRMDWLCAHCVEVRYPLMYGSREMFRAQQDSEEWDLPHHTTLREQVDAAMANEVQE